MDNSTSVLRLYVDVKLTIYSFCHFYFSEILHQFLHPSQTNGSLCSGGDNGMSLPNMEIGHFSSIWKFHSVPDCLQYTFTYDEGKK